MISVLMTCYNREKYITLAIESVLCSTYKNFELIIVDDGSKDNTVSIAKGFAEIDKRVRVYQNEVNLGDYPNRNRAASYATGKYVKYVDSDDLIYPWGLELMVTMMEKFPQSGWGLCSMQPDRERLFPFELNPREAYLYHYQGPGLFSRAPLSTIIKTDVFHKVGGFKPIRMAGDFEMWHRLAQDFNVVLMPQGMVWYRSHNEQEATENTPPYINLYEKLKTDFLNSENCPLEKNVSKQILKRESARVRGYILRNILQMDFQMLKVNIRNLKIYNS